MFRIREHKDKKVDFQISSTGVYFSCDDLKIDFSVYDVSVVSKKNEIIIPCKQLHDIPSYLLQKESGILHILCRLQLLS